MRKLQVAEGQGMAVKSALLGGVPKKGFFMEVTFEQRPE